MKVIGQMIKLVEKENLFMLMEIYMMENGLMTKQTVKENIYIIMEHSMLGIGKMINNMGTVKKHGQIMLIMRVNMKKGKNMVKEN